MIWGLVELALDARKIIFICLGLGLGLGLEMTLFNDKRSVCVFYVWRRTRHKSCCSCHQDQFWVIMLLPSGITTIEDWDNMLDFLLSSTVSYYVVVFDVQDKDSVISAVSGLSSSCAPTGPLASGAACGWLVGSSRPADRLPSSCSSARSCSGVSWWAGWPLAVRLL